MKIVADAHIPYVEHYFKEQGELVLKKGRAISNEDLIDADVLLVRSITSVDEKLLAGTKVKFVGSVTAGADHLDTKWLDEAHIDWSIAAGFNAPPVADYVVSVIAALQKNDKLPTSHLKAGVIGVGNVGKLVVERLKILNIESVVCDPVRAQTDESFNSVFLEELAGLDLITLHVPLTFSGLHPTYHFIEKNFLKRQKKNCILLNASRGAVINSKDLLSDGTHLQWCFDVWEHEPHIDKNILEKACIATPHIAGYSRQSKIRGIDMIYRAACKKNIIRPQLISPIKMPTQQVLVRGEKNWREIVLNIFDPLQMTSLMRSKMLDHSNEDSAFDDMRNEFNHRYEFSFNEIEAELSEEDKRMVGSLGIKVKDDE